MATIFLQNACFAHRYIRSRDTSAIVERPERLRAVELGLAAVIARFESVLLQTFGTSAEPNDIVSALEQMTLATGPSKSIPVVTSSASVNVLQHPAVKFVHGDIDGDVYLQNLQRWAKDSLDKITKGDSEIPEELSQGDLYLCPQSISAIEGAIGTVCEAVDTVLNCARDVPGNRAFVAVRPPGHHCGEDTPSGFCFVNNVTIGAAHAHLQHGIKRVIIFDIDLHHGNGTQSIAWQINEETYRKTLASEQNESESEVLTNSGLQIYYSSIHDILSYPCEDGTTALVQAASTSIDGSHGQYIENVHLQPYTSEDHFWDILYPKRYTRILNKARDFVAQTGGAGDDVLVFISCGFDACEHEYPSMSRHNRKVPASFYHRFTKDACALADELARGRLVSVLEGGYSDRALISGTMAHVSGLVGADQEDRKVDEGWWDVENLAKLEKALKKRKGGRPSLNPQPPLETWLERAIALFNSFDASSAYSPTPPPAIRQLPPSSMALRGRKKVANKIPAQFADPEPGTARAPPHALKDITPPGNVPIGARPVEEVTSVDGERGEVIKKKLPRVILRLGSPPGAAEHL